MAQVDHDGRGGSGQNIIAELMTLNMKLFDVK